MGAFDATPSLLTYKDSSSRLCQLFVVIQAWPQASGHGVHLTTTTIDISMILVSEEVLLLRAGLTVHEMVNSKPTGQRIYLRLSVSGIEQD